MGGGGPHHCMSLLSNPSVACLCCSVIIKLHVRFKKTMSHVTLFLPPMLDLIVPFVEFKDLKDLDLCPCAPDKLGIRGNII